MGTGYAIGTTAILAGLKFANLGADFVLHPDNIRTKEVKKIIYFRFVTCSLGFKFILGHDKLLWYVMGSV